MNVIKQLVSSGKRNNCNKNNFVCSIGCWFVNVNFSFLSSFLVFFYLVLALLFICSIYRAVFRYFLGTPFFEIVIFPYQRHGCLRVRKLQVFKTSDPLKLFCGVRTCIRYKAIIFNASKQEGMIANLLLASIISTQWKLLIYFEQIFLCL